MRIVATLALVAASECIGCGQILGISNYKVSDDAGATPKVFVTPCGSLEAPDSSGTCHVAGVPKEGCATGFLSDGHGGCRFQYEGDDCTVPFEVNTPSNVCLPKNCLNPPAADYYVDANATQTGDGSSKSPFKTIGEATAVATDGTSIFVAGVNPGPLVYTENVRLEHSVTLASSCQHAEIRGRDGSPAVTVVVSGSGKPAIRDLAISGGSTGVLVTATDARSGNVALSGVAIHDVNGPGVVLKDVSAQVDTTSIRRVAESGMLVEATMASSAPSVTVTASVIEGVNAAPSGDRGWCAAVLETPAIEGGFGFVAVGTPSLAIDGSVLADCREMGVYASGATLAVSGTVVERVRPRARDGLLGQGIAVERFDLIGTILSRGPGRDATVSIEGSLIQDVSDIGVRLTGVRSAKISNTTIAGIAGRGILPDGGVSGCLEDGIGVWAVSQPNDSVDGGRMPSDITIEDSSINGARSAGIELEGVSANVTGTLVRNTQPRVQAGCPEAFGDGIVVVSSDALPTDLTLSASRIDQSERGAVVRFGRGGVVTIESAALGCNAAGLLANAGSARIEVPRPSSVVCDCDGKGYLCGVETRKLESGRVGRP